jgi:flagellar protein FlaJ
MSGETRGTGMSVKLELAYRELPMSFRDFLISRVALVFCLSLFTVIIWWWLFPDIITWELLALLIVAIPGFFTFVTLVWPVVEWERRGKAIDKDMHLFITRIGTLSTGETARQDVLEMLAKMEGYRELADEVRKIYKLAEEWHVGLSASCRFIARQTPSDLFSDFLYRLAHSMEAGDSAIEFFQAEQTVFMDQYAAQYSASLKSVEVYFEAFLALIIASLFVMVILDLFPLLTGLSANLLISLAVIFFMFIEGFYLWMLYVTVPQEKVWYNGPLDTPESREMKRRLAIGGLVAVLFTVLIVFGAPFMTVPLAIAFAVTPFLYASIYVNTREMTIKRKDDNFAAFIRTLGSTQEATGKVAITALKKLSYHDFGPLTEDIQSLYKRVAMRIDRQRAWQLFGAETNSELISKFSEMFSEGTSAGGEPRAISRIISNNFSKILSLRIEKFQTQGRITGVLYGLAIAMTVILFLALFLVEGFFDMFGALDPVEGFESLFIFKTETFNTDVLHGMIIGLLLFHTVISTIMTRMIGGGHWVGGITHFVGMMWIIAICSIITKYIIVQLL